MRKNGFVQIDGGAVFEAPLFLYCDYIHGRFYGIDGDRRFKGEGFEKMFDELRRIRAARLVHFRSHEPQLLVIVNDLNVFSVLIEDFCGDAQSTGQKEHNGAAHKLEVRTEDFLFRSFNFIANSRPEALCDFFKVKNPVQAMLLFYRSIAGKKKLYRMRWSLASITKKNFFQDIRGELWEAMKEEGIFFHAMLHYRDMFAGSKSGALLRFDDPERGFRKILHGVQSFDKKSAYPSVLVNDPYFPLSRPVRVVQGKAEALRNAMQQKHWFKLVIRTDKDFPELRPFRDPDDKELYGVEFYDMMLLKEVLGVPAKRFAEILNGSQWSFYTCKHTGYLSDAFRKRIVSLYIQKNAISDKSNFYRFTLKTQLDIINGKAIQKKPFRTLKEVNKYYTGRGENYLLPQHAMHAISAVRYELMKLVKLLGSGCIAYDTDGIKCTDGSVFAAMNELIQLRNERAGFPQSDIGLWLHEWSADRFLQLCTKSYMYETEGKLTVKHAGITDADFDRYAETVEGDLMQHFTQPRDITVKGRYIYHTDRKIFYRELNTFRL